MTTQSRTVRVFLSSTFRDFAEERDLLVRKVFPELRRKCRARQVELVDVDLRWGITEEEAQQGRVLPICLAEIDRSRPFFMGFIGERYGWVPEAEKYDLSLIMEQPWLDEHRGGKSVTELEMLHGVLNNPAMEDRAFFYFRDAAYSNSKGAAYLSESKADKAKLEALKDRIRQSGYPVVENYPSPEALAERVKEDLWCLIDKAFPENEVPDALTQERMRHEAYSAARRGLYLGGEHYFKFLDESIAKDGFNPVLITGESGGGKSSLVANWVLDWSARHPTVAVIVHHLGCGADAGDPVRIAVRIMQEISLVTGDEFKPESDPDRQLEQLPQWFAIASTWAQRKKTEFLIVLDGLDKLSDRKHLRWFPIYLPPHVKLVVSCLEGEILDSSKARLSWVILNVKPFSKDEQAQFITEYLGRYRKALTLEQTLTLQGHSLSGNPLFLLTVLEELRVFGVHEKLDKRLQALLSPPSSKAETDAPTVDDVFEHVLARIEADLGKKPVQHAMEAIWASRAGLYQDELLGIAKLVPAQWAAIQNALDESIYESCGKINFGHDYLRKAVEDRYTLTGKKKLILHRRLAEWFSAQEVDRRVASELPWQFRQADKPGKLKKFLLNFENVYQMESSGASWIEFFDFWNYCGGEFEVRKYLPLLNKIQNGSPTQKEITGAKITSNFIARSKWLFISVEYDRAIIDLVQKFYGSDHDEHLNSLATLGNHLGRIWSEDAHKEAESLLRFVCNKRCALLDESDPRVAEAKHDLGSLLSKTMLANQETKKEATTLLSQALDQTKKSYGNGHYETCISINNLAIHYWRVNRKAEALELLEIASNQTESLLGESHPESLLFTNNLAAMLRDNHDFIKSEKLLRKSLAGLEKNIGKNHRDTLACMQDIALLLDMTGDSSGAAEINAEIFKRRGLTPPQFIQ